MDELCIGIYIDPETESFEDIYDLFDDVLEYIQSKGYAVDFGDLHGERFMEWVHGFNTDKLKEIYGKWREEIKEEDGR